MFDGFQGNKNSARTISDVTAKDYDYRASTLTLNKDKPRFITSPLYLGTMAEGFLNGYQGLGNPAVSVSNMGTDLNSDFNKSKWLTENLPKRLSGENSGNHSKAEYENHGGRCKRLYAAICVLREPDSLRVRTELSV